MSRLNAKMLIFGFFLLTSANCDSRAAEQRSGDDLSSALEMDCLGFCVNMGCTDEVFVPDCVSECLEREEKSAKYGAACENAYVPLMQCLGSLGDCGLGWTWNALRGNDLDYPCRSETEMFEAECPGLWPKAL